MRPNPLAGGLLPHAVDVGGESVPLDADWRSGVRISRALGSAEKAVARAEASLRIAFGDPLPETVAARRREALEALCGWLSMGDEAAPRPPGKGTRPEESAARTWDWDRDSEAAVADFQRFYGIDLTDPALGMHWWRFLALFRQLPAESASMTRIRVRSSSLDDFSGDARRAMREAKVAFMLPARTEREALRNTELLRG